MSNTKIFSYIKDTNCKNCANYLKDFLCAEFGKIEDTNNGFCSFFIKKEQLRKEVKNPKGIEEGKSTG